MEDSSDKSYPKNSCNNYNPSNGNFKSYITEELENMIKKLKIDSVSHKISNDYRSNTLVAVIDSLFYYHDDKKIDDLKTFFFEVNKKLCEKPLNEKAVESIWSQSTMLLKGDVNEKHPVKNNENVKSKADSLCDTDSKNKKEFTVFKYTLDGNIYKSVIITGKPFFVTVDSNDLK